MLTFTAFVEGRGPPDKVHVNPAAVASVVETERRTLSAWARVAVIRMLDGVEHVVCDEGRTVVRQIQRRSLWQ